MVNLVTHWAAVAGLGLASYLIGAVPFGLLVARLKGIDITKVGSGNIGATNVFRSVSKPLGILTFALDALKGWGPACFFPGFVQGGDATTANPLLAVLFAALAIAGHTWPVYLKFKGGKGVATSAGALIGIAPLAVAIGLLVWIGLLAASRYVSVASIGAAVAVAIAAWVFYARQAFGVPVALTLLAALIIWRHRANIQRLRAGTEHRFGKPKT